ncbi:hypothetical protein K227x_39240 [Rubripirellula lacrimiformis]|uniref:General secretion pathway protein I n=2 Tax=Rubripirellula lacrimiformis TaxID=1930273 RepID=A0A517NEG5_9BACT|nr:hypothetical protein K227x_39240 [Rubripirellula lacrimiformis]
MEMVIATAVLAGSGVALFSLIGQATQLAQKAEQRTVALQMAQSTLDEFIATRSDAESEMEGSFESDPRWRYKIELSDVEANGDGESKLKRIVVSIYRSTESGTPSADNTDSAVVSLVRWIGAAKPMSTVSSDALDLP